MSKEKKRNPKTPKHAGRNLPARTYRGKGRVYMTRDGQGYATHPITGAIKRLPQDALRETHAKE